MQRHYHANCPTKLGNPEMNAEETATPPPDYEPVNFSNI